MKPRFPLWLILLAGWTLLVQALILGQGWAANPFSRAPIADAQVYWDWAGRIAGGEWLSETPFLAAPLYPYLVGLLRALGSGLPGVYVFQALLHIASVLLIADAGRRRFDATSGLVAGLGFSILADPAYYTGRILGVGLQLSVVAWMLWQAALLRERRSTTRAAVLGVASGLGALANPALLLAVPILAVWVAGGGRERDPRDAVVFLFVALLLISPATLHNRSVSGETILISAHGGVTFFHGNAPGASGTYQPIPGVSANRVQQNLDAFRLASEATGNEGWRSTSRYFLGRGLAYLAAHPREALILEMRKLWWLLSGRVYGDIYLPLHERAEPFGSRLRLAPLSLSSLLPLSLLGFVLAVRSGWRKSLPELLLYVVPALVVLVFWYSPRYRIAIAPAALLLAAHALTRAVRAWSARPRRRGLAVAAALLLVTGFATGRINVATGFDDPAELRPSFLHSVGEALRLQDRVEEALPYLEAALAEGFDTGTSRLSLARARSKRAEALLVEGGAPREAEALEAFAAAIVDLRACLGHDPRRLEARENLASLEFWFWQLGRQSAEAARSELLAALALAEQTGDVAATARLRDKLVRLPPGSGTRR